MRTIKKGDTGNDVRECQRDLTLHGYDCTADGIFGPNTEKLVKAFQKASGLISDGIVGKNTWAALQAPPEEEQPRQLDWANFVPLLGPAMNATYSLSGAEMPKFPPGVTFLSNKYLGKNKTNCSMFTAYLLGNGFGGPFTIDQWNEWQVAKGSSQSNYDNYGPGVVGDWGVGTLMPKNSIPKDGVYLIQTFSSWPKGHSWIVLDYDESTSKILTLESNTGGSGLNGVGFADLGPIRSTNAHNWKQRVNTTWSKRVSGASQVYMARLDIDHKSVLDWISSQ